MAFVHSVVLQPDAVGDAGVVAPHVLPQESRTVGHRDPAVPKAGVKVLRPRGVERGGVIQRVPGRPYHDMHRALGGGGGGGGGGGVARPPVHGARPLVAVVVTPQGHVHPVQVYEVLQLLLHHQGHHVVAKVLLTRVHWTVTHKDEPRGGAPVYRLEVALQPTVLGGASGEVVLCAHDRKVHHPVLEAVPPGLVAREVGHVEAVVERDPALPSRIVAVVTPPGVEPVAGGVAGVLVPAHRVILLVVADAHHVRGPGGVGLDERHPRVPDVRLAQRVGEVPLVHDEGDVVLFHLAQDHGGYLGGARCGRETHVPVRDEREGLFAGRVQAGGKSSDVAEYDTPAVLVEVFCARGEAGEENVVEVAGVDECFGRVGGRPAHVRVAVRVGRSNGGVHEGVRG